MDDSRGRADAAANDEAADDEDEAPVVQLAALAVLGVGLTALFLGYSWFWLVFVLGFAVFVPMVKLASDALGADADADAPARKARERPDVAESKQDALDTLRDRYARGDLSDEEFERKVERLLETETPESAREHVAREAERGRESESEAETEREKETDREADREPE